MIENDDSLNRITQFNLIFPISMCANELTENTFPS